MLTDVKTQGFTNKDLHDCFIAIPDGASFEDKDVARVVHVLGSDEVTIHSNQPSWGAVPVKGREELKMLRDALTEICDRAGIK